MQYTIKEASKARQAIIASIQHWYEDGVVPNEKGWRVISQNQYDFNWYLYDDTYKADMRLTGSYCPLCEKYKEEFSCEKCPWHIVTGFTCFDMYQEYEICLINSFNISTCRAMLNKLWSIGRNDNNLPYNNKQIKYYFYL